MDRRHSRTKKNNIVQHSPHPKGAPITCGKWVYYMAKAKEKNTRLIFNDEARIAMYEAMPAEQFKELIMSLLKYQYGDETFADTIKDPMVKALFLKEKVDIDKNEKRWREISEIKRRAGKNGGRPPKEESSKTAQEDNSNFDQDLEKAKEMYRTNDWRYTHQLNDMKNRYRMDYFTIKEMVEI